MLVALPLSYKTLPGDFGCMSPVWLLNTLSMKLETNPRSTKLSYAPPQNSPAMLLICEYVIPPRITNMDHSKFALSELDNMQKLGTCASIPLVIKTGFGYGIAPWRIDE